MNDAEFLEAYEHGFVHVCKDGVKRRLFPRLYWYLADYPEKWVNHLLLGACLIPDAHRCMILVIRVNGECPCPRCLVKKKDLSNLGAPSDMKTRTSRTRLYDQAWVKRVERADKLVKQGYGLEATSVENILKERSETPTKV